MQATQWLAMAVTAMAVALILASYKDIGRNDRARLMFSIGLALQVMGAILFAWFKSH